MTVIYASAWSSGFLDFLQVSATTTSRGTYGHQHFAHGTYTAPSEQAAKDRFAEFTAEWGQRYPAIVRLWESFWAEFVPFLEYDVEIRRVICTTNAIESINARYRRAVRARGHFPNETAALKCLYLVTRSLDPTGGGRARWVMRWKPALNAFATTFAGRFERTTQ
jgi:putative transposase